MVAGQRFRLAVGVLAVGLAAISVPVAAADPADPAPPPGPVPAALVAAPAPAADPAAVVVPPDGVQHLPSPDSLPPGTTQQAPEHPTAGLLRDIWHALRDGEMTGPDALKLLATRPVDPQKLADSKPSNQVGSAAPAADAPAAPAPAPAAPAPAAPAPAAPAPAPALVPAA